MAKEQDQLIKRVELKVSVNCCDGCRSKVLKALNLKGVLRTEVHPTAGRVTVVGDVDADRLVKRLAKVGKIAEVIPQPPPDAEKKTRQDDCGNGGDKNSKNGENADGKAAKHGAADDGKHGGGKNSNGLKAAVGFHRAEAPPAMAVPVLQLPCYATCCTTPPAMTTTTTAAYGFGGCYHGIPPPPPALMCRGLIPVVRPEPTTFIDEGRLYGGDDDTAGCHVM